jgi:hypothetical protein
MIETNSEITSRPTSTTGGKQTKRGLPGLQIELDSEELIELLSSLPATVASGRMLDLARSINEVAKELNERVMATGSYAA